MSVNKDTGMHTYFLVVAALLACSGTKERRPCTAMEVAVIREATEDKREHRQEVH